MQNVSEQYKNAIKQPLRNRSTMFVSIGKIDPTAQLSARVDDTSTAIYYSDNESIFNGSTNRDYSTLEMNFTPADGSMFFTPRSTETEIPLLDTGFTSNALMQNTLSDDVLIYAVFDEVETPTASNPFVLVIKFADGSAPDTVSLYLRWDGDAYYGWSSLPVTNNQVRVQTSSAPTGKYHISGFKMRGSYATDNYRRMRVKSVKFGDGLPVYADIIENTEQTNYCSKIDENLPTSDVTVNLINYDNRYDADNPNNPLALLDSGKREVNIYYGYDVDGNETWEWVHGGKFLSDSWSSGKYKASITARDELQSNNNLFVHSNTELGRFHKAGYWLEQIMSELGIDDYEYDSDMDNIDMGLSLVKTMPAKQALQMLANYCCKTLFVDDNNKFIITSATNLTEEVTIDSDAITVTDVSYTQAFTGSLTETYELVEAVVVCHGRQVYKESVDVSGSSYSYTFVPRYGKGEYDVSIVGRKTASTPDFEITANDILNDVNIEKEELVKEVVVPYYTPVFLSTTETTVMDETVVIPSDNYVYTKSFNDVIYGDITVSIVIDLADESDLISYTATRLETPTLDVIYGEDYEINIDTDKYIYCIYEYDSSDTQINTIIINASTYSYTPSSASVVSAVAFIRYPNDANISTSDVTSFIFKQLVESYEQDPTDYWFYTLNAGTYHIVIKAGGYFNFTSANVIYPVNATGKSLTWDNPLVGDKDRALIVAQFVGDYYASNIQYDYEYRGNPELNTNDIILQENDFVSDMQVVVTEHTIKFNGGLSGNITARRRITNGLGNT